MPISNEVAIIGTGVTPFGVHHDWSLTDLVGQAARAALDDAGLAPDQIEAAWLGVAEPTLTGLEGDSADPVVEALGRPGMPASRVSNYCITGMESVRHAAMAIASGEFDYVVAVGAEKMRDVLPKESLVAKTKLQTDPIFAKGRTAPGQFALRASRYLHEYGYSPETLAQVSVKNHRHAMANPDAHFRKEVTVEEVLAAPRIAEPLGLLDCTPTTDGAAAAVLTSRKRAESSGKPYAVIRGVGLATMAGYHQIHFRQWNDHLGFAATREASSRAYRQAGIESPLEEIDVLELHDCFTIAELLAYEDLGLVNPGEGGKLLETGETTHGGRLPTNVSGGLQACGHPVGATGARMVAEITRQVLGQAGERQVIGARTGVAHTLGGPGVHSCVFVVGSGA